MFKFSCNSVSWVLVFLTFWMKKWKYKQSTSATNQILMIEKALFCLCVNHISIKWGFLKKKSNATFWFNINLTGCFFSWNFRNKFFFFPPKEWCYYSDLDIWYYELLCHQKFIWWNPIPPCDVIKRRTLWEVVGIKWGHEGGALLKGVSALLRTKRELVASFCLPPTRMLGEFISLHPGRELSLEFIHAATLITDFQPPELWRITSCCLWALNLWQFAIEAQTKT